MVEITLEVSIPDEILIEGVAPQSDEEWQGLIASHIRQKLDVVSNQTRDFLGKTLPRNVADQSDEKGEEYRTSLTFVESCVTAYRALNSPGIKVEVKR